MQVVLDPISAPEYFERDLEKELARWLEATIFDPLLSLFDVERVNSGSETWVPFPPELESFNVARADLPQIRKEHREELARFLEGRGIPNTRQRLMASSLKPTQSHYAPDRMKWLQQHDAGDQAILVSSDLRILDGHHQWMSLLNDGPQREIDAIVFNANVPTLICEINRFPSIVRENASGTENFSPIIKAIQDGKISYSDGVFSGTFSSSISRALRGLGATFNARDKTFRIEQRLMPYGLRGAISEAKTAVEKIHKAIESRLATIAQTVAGSADLGFRIDDLTEKALKDLNRQFSRSVRAAAKTTPEAAVDAITVPPDFGPSVIADVRRNLTENLTLSVKDFTAEEVVKLRELVEENWTSGGRLDRLREILEDRLGISKRKAAFLARQETSMVASEFARARAQEIGSTSYVWHTRHDDRVRDDHQELNGKTYEWDDPPLVDKKRARHANPGMDFGCRCQARPVLNLSARRVA